MNQQQIDALSVDQLWNVVCLAKKECRSGLEHDYGACAAGCINGYVWALPGMQERCPCLVMAQYGFDGTNHWSDKGGCNNCYLRAGRGQEHVDCTNCHGTGYTAKRDPFLLLQLAYHLVKAHDISHQSFSPTSYPFVKRGDTDSWVFSADGYVRGEWEEKVIVRGYGKSSEEALLRAVAQALKALEEKP